LPADAGPDAARGDARPEAGPGPDADAGPWPDATQHDFCDQPFFKLPIDGQSQITLGIDLDSSRVAWTFHDTSPGTRGDIHALDLSSCVERVITQGALAGNLRIHGDEVIHDDIDDATAAAFCSDLYTVTWAGGSRQRLTSTPQCEGEPRTNGQHVIFRRLETIDDAASLRLWDRQTDAQVELSPAEANIESFDLNDRYAVWLAYTQDPLSVGRDLFYRDLSAGESFHVDSTYDRWQLFTQLWEDWVIVKGGDNWLESPFFVELINLATQEERSLLEGDYAGGIPRIDSGLVTYHTSANSGTEYSFPSDIVLYEIASDTGRRLTTEPGYLALIRFSYPYLLMLRFLNLGDTFMNDFYVANLVALGITDGMGQLIPGDPVIDPP
jgi:hypothetical protein